MKEIEVVNYYDENGATVLIPLESDENIHQKMHKNISQNIRKQKLQSKSCKSKSKRHVMKLFILISLIQQVQTASPKDIAEIREELMEEGYIRQ